MWLVDANIATTDYSIGEDATVGDIIADNTETEEVFNRANPAKTSKHGCFDENENFLKLILMITILIFV